MIAVIQRVLDAKVLVAGRVVGQIGPGLVALVAVHRTDSYEDVKWTANKIAGLRIFRNEERHFDLDVRQASGSVLLVSNFTVAGQTRHGRRPSFEAAADSRLGRMRFEELVAAVKALGLSVQTGEFGADMQVVLSNDGPVTLILDSAAGKRAQE